MLVTGAARGIGASITEQLADLVAVRTTGAPLAEVDWETVYGLRPGGYYDYSGGRASELNQGLMDTPR